MENRFEELKKEVIKRAEENDACEDQFDRAKEAKELPALLEVITDNISWCRDNIFDEKFLKKYSTMLNNGKENMGIGNSGYRNSGDLNSGYRNSGDRNSGDLNSGDRNSGDLNSGYRNSGDRNSGDRNSGYRNSGDRNSGDRNSGDRNSGYRNSGDRNSGYRNSGDRNSGYRNSGDLNSGDRNSGDRNSGDLNSGDLNSGDRNSGDLNSGDLNSGDLNSGYRNSGVFCNKKRQDKVVIFNKECNMTWNEWENHPVRRITFNLKITEWVGWDDMTNQEKEVYPKAYVCEGYVKKYDYKEAWANLWKTLSNEDKEQFKQLPNFDSEIFEDITGIKI